MKTKHILTSLFFSILSLQSISANVILHQDTKVLMDVDVIQNFNDQNYTIEKGATLIMESGATLQNIDTLTVNGILDAQSDSSIVNLKNLINNGEIDTSPYITYTQKENNSIVTDKNSSSSKNATNLNTSISVKNTISNTNTSESNSNQSEREETKEEETQNSLDISTSTQTEPDKEGTNSSNNQETAVLGISQDSNEVSAHSGYTEKDVSAINYSGVILLIFFTSIITFYFVRKEEKILS